MTDFKVGDVVRLKGQTRRMTVVEITRQQGGSHDQRAVRVVWFAEDGTIQYCLMDKMALVPVPE